MDKGMILALYTHFEAQEADYIADGLKPVKYIDKYKGQPLNPEQFEYYDLPAIFISRKTLWTLEGASYKADVAWAFHIVTEPTWETSNIAANKEDGLEYFDFIEKVRETLDAFKTDYTGTMFRTEDDEMDTGVIVYELLGYKSEYYATSKLSKKYDSEYPTDITFEGNLKRKRSN